MDNKQQTDDFWDIEHIVPKRKISRYESAKADLAEINLDGGNGQKGQSSFSLSSAPRKDKTLKKATELLCEYTPSNKFIKNVKLYKWPSEYNFYEKFRLDAKYFFSAKAEECEHVPFFSYIPQYYQMNKAQLAWYLWWRANVRNGVFLYCDFSYIMLYIYELINIPETLPEKETRDILCSLWVNYRKRFPRLDKYLSEWICDFCLIYELSPNLDILAPIKNEIIESASVREFYLPSSDGNENSYESSLLCALSNYDYKRSKYAAGENAEIYDTHIPRAVSIALEKSGFAYTSAIQSTKVLRDSFNGALCASDNKRVIELEYYSLSQSFKLKSMITDIVKYSENCIRAALGIKSKLGNITLGDEIKSSISGYMRENLSYKKPIKIEEYERKYDIKESEFSAEKAKDIEKASWETTELLVDTFGDNSASLQEEKKEEKIPEKQNVSAEENVYAELISILENDEKEFLIFAAKSDFTAQNKLCEEVKKLPDVVAEIINSSAADICGDVILEKEENGYAIIEDYKEDVIKWIM